MNIIELEEEEASLFGYVVSATEKNIQNYLAENFCFEIAFFVQDAIERLGKPVALLRNMYVDESAQGKGLGSLLLSSELKALLRLFCDARPSVKY